MSKQRPSGLARRALVKRVAERDGWFCRWCGIPLAIVAKANPRREAATIDHLYPRSLGGSNDLPNLVIACEPCNHDRGNSASMDYRPRRRWRPELETAENTVPLTWHQKAQCGTLMSRAECEMSEIILGSRVTGSLVHENATIHKNRQWRIAQRALAAQPDKLGPPAPGANPPVGPAREPVPA